MKCLVFDLVPCTLLFELAEYVSFDLRNLLVDLFETVYFAAHIGGTMTRLLRQQSQLWCHFGDLYFSQVRVDLLRLVKLVTL